MWDDIMKLDAIIGIILKCLHSLAGFLKHQSAVDLEKKEDLKELNSFSDLFHLH